MKIEEIVEKSKAFENFLIDFLDNEEQSEESYQNIVNLLSSNNFINNKQELKLFLNIVQNVFHNHYRSSNFYQNFSRIFSNFLDSIHHHLSNSEIFNIFKDDKKLLLLLIENKHIALDDKILKEMKSGKYNYYHYPKFFHLISCKESKEENFSEKVNIGENDSYICQLIRNDSVEEFVSHVNRANISIQNYKIEDSIFETNPFLLDNNPTLIEYAAFFGSIQIFNYLYMNGAEMTSSLWNYAIHSNNADIIHILEDRKVALNDKCFEEAIKCHHNKIAEYIQANLIENIDKKELFLIALHYFNFEFFPSEFDFNNNECFVYACQYDHFFIVEDILSKKEIDVNYKLECPYFGYKIREKEESEDDRNQKQEKKEKPVFKDFADWKEWDNGSRKEDRLRTRNAWKSNCEKEEISALHCAVENDDIDIVKLLLSNQQINVNDTLIRYYKNEKNSYRHSNLDTKREEKTALHIAVENGNYEIVELLLENNKIDVNKKTMNCFLSCDDTREMITPIHFAVDNEDIEIVELLVNHPEININLKSTYERWWNGGREEYEEETPLHLAVEKGNLEICKIILSNANVNVNQKLIEFYTTANLSYVHKRKEAALHIAIYDRQYEIVELLLSNKSIDVNDLSFREYRFYMIERRKQMKSPLLIAIEKNDLVMVNLLLNCKNIDLNFGLLNIGGGSNLRDRKSIGLYNPQIRKDKERPRRRQSRKKLDYLNLRKDNCTNNGVFSNSKMRKNISKYRNIEEEEDICDELDFRYRIFDKISPNKAAEKMKNNEIRNLLEDACRDQMMEKHEDEKEIDMDEEETQSFDQYDDDFDDEDEDDDDYRY